jgi:DNA repair exonuclease SbcCD nuclease subunit
MSYRALYVADIHVGNSLPWSVKDPTTLISDRCLDIMDVLTQMGDYAHEHEIQDIWILGDLIDKRLIDAVTLKLVTDKLIKLGQENLRIFLVPGNHEAGDAAGRHFTLDAFSSMGFWVAGIDNIQPDSQLSYCEPIDGFEVLAMPYMPVARATMLLEKSCHHLPQLLMIHQTIKGAAVGGWKSPDGLEPAFLETVAPIVLSGHFHERQSITARTHYLGAPLQHTFADTGQTRGYWDIEFVADKFHPSRTFVPVKGAPLFFEVDWRDGNDIPKLDWVEKSYVNLKVTGSQASVDKRWQAALEWCTNAKQNGLRMVRPVKAITAEPSRKRITIGDGDRPTWDTIISSYLDTADCTGLNRERLEAIGKELMTDADR